MDWLRTFLPTELVGYSPGRVPLSTVNSPRPLASNELICVLETTVSLVNALFSATRLMMSSGEMTCTASRRVSQPGRRSGLQRSANLNLGEDGQENIRSVVSGAPRHNEQQRAHSGKCTRFDEYCDDIFVQSANPSWRPCGSVKVPTMDNKPDDDHKGEEDVECD